MKFHGLLGFLDSGVGSRGVTLAFFNATMYTLVNTFTSRFVLQLNDTLQLGVSAMYLVQLSVGRGTIQQEGKKLLLERGVPSQVSPRR